MLYKDMNILEFLVFMVDTDIKTKLFIAAEEMMQIEIKPTYRMVIKQIVPIKTWLPIWTLCALSFKNSYLFHFAQLFFIFIIVLLKAPVFYFHQKTLNSHWVTYLYLRRIYYITNNCKSTYKCFKIMFNTFLHIPWSQLVST